MVEYIEREAALAFQDELEPVMCLPMHFPQEKQGTIGFSATKDADLVAYLQAIPTADVIPRSEFEAYAKNQEDAIKDLVAELEKKEVHGKWIEDDDVYGTDYHCSNCHEYALAKYGTHDLVRSNFCPNCGADMRGNNDGRP